MISVGFPHRGKADLSLVKIYFYILYFPIISMKTITYDHVYVYKEFVYKNHTFFCIYL